MKTMAIGEYTYYDNDIDKDVSYTYYTYNEDSKPMAENKMENRVDKKIAKGTPEEMFKFQMGIPDGILKMNNKISAFSGLSIEPVDTQDQANQKVNPHQTFFKTDEKVPEKDSVEEEKEDPKEVGEMITVEQTAQSTTEGWMDQMDGNDYSLTHQIQPKTAGGTSVNRRRAGEEGRGGEGKKENKNKKRKNKNKKRKNKKKGKKEKSKKKRKGKKKPEYTSYGNVH